MNCLRYFVVMLIGFPKIVRNLCFLLKADFKMRALGIFLSLTLMMIVTTIKPIEISVGLCFDG
jgi:hypothetical protein